MCSWPEGSEEPATPVPYSEEVWTGLEYMLASHLIARGLVEEGLTVVRAARARHDGSRRNPYNDIECGSHYARSLSSYALANAWSGLTFDQRIGEIGFKPAARRKRALLLVRRPRLGRDRPAWGRRDAFGQGRRTCRFAPAVAFARGTRVPSTASRRNATATSFFLAEPRVLARRRQRSSSRRASVAELELKGVRKSFQSVEVIHGIDLIVKSGSFTVFVGPSGCGKSTLLRE